MFSDFFPENFFDKPDVHLHVAPEVFDYIYARAATAAEAVKALQKALDETCGEDHLLKSMLCGLFEQMYQQIEIHKIKQTHRSN